MDVVCQLEVTVEVGDEQVYCGHIWINKMEMIVIAELYECLCLLGSGGACMEGVRGELLIRLLELVQGQVII